MVHAGQASPIRRDLVFLLAALLVLLSWEFSGADLWLIRLYGNPQGFALQHHPLLSHVMHDGGRLLAWVVLAVLAWDAYAPFWKGPSRRMRVYAIALVLLSALAISGLKRISLTSCPWDLAEFGGQWAYVPHWLLQVHDGGPGHCFPSGHAASAFGFLLAWGVWRHFNLRVAQFMLAGSLSLGALFAWVQMARGAHYLSHSMWTAWLCWAAGLGVSQVIARLHAPSLAADLSNWPAHALVHTPGQGRSDPDRQQGEPGGEGKYGAP
jgi:membrane-associated PAP2 superfamily phosphatase